MIKTEIEKCLKKLLKKDLIVNDYTIKKTKLPRKLKKKYKKEHKIALTSEVTLIDSIPQVVIEVNYDT